MEIKSLEELFAEQNKKDVLELELVELLKEKEKFEEDMWFEGEKKEKFRQLCKVVEFPFVWSDENFINVQVNPNYNYYIDKIRLKTKDNLLSWIEQLIGKNWCTTSLIRSLIQRSEVEFNK